MIKLNFLKWWQTAKTFWATHTTYRFNFLMVATGPALVFLFVKYNLWTSIYGHEDTPSIIKGYNLAEMLNYHIWVLVVSLMSKGYFSTNLSQDIRLGKISSYLIYPFNFWEFHTAGWMAYQGLQIIVTIITIAIIALVGLLPPFDLTTFLAGIIYTTFVSLFWFTLQYFLGLLAFWLEETWTLRVIANIAINFLSGAVLPLELFPSAFVAILKYTPFPYLTYYPVKIFMGESTLELGPIVALLGWTGLVVVGICLVWKKGLKLYTAAGM